MFLCENKSNLSYYSRSCDALDSDPVPVLVLRVLCAADLSGMWGGDGGSLGARQLNARGWYEDRALHQLTCITGHTHTHTHTHTRERDGSPHSH